MMFTGKVSKSNPTAPHLENTRRACMLRYLDVVYDVTFDAVNVGQRPILEYVQANGTFRQSPIMVRNGYIMEGDPASADIHHTANPEGR
jgi:hypothetical protein